MITERAITEAERYVERMNALIKRLQELHGFSESEALEFIAMFGDEV